MTNYQIVLGGLLFAACSSSSLRSTNAPDASEGRGTATGGVLGTGGSDTGGVLGTGGSGTGGVLGTGGSGTGGVLGTGGRGTGGVLGAAGSGAGGCDMAACRNGQVVMTSCNSTYVPYVSCDVAKSGVQCVPSGVCPILDAGVTGTGDGGTNACGNSCAIDEVCVAYFDGNCLPAGIACRKVSSSCKESAIVRGVVCFQGPCNDDICGPKVGQGSWGCNYTSCPLDTSRADAKCYGIGDVGGN